VSENSATCVGSAAGLYVNKTLDGAKPADLAVEQARSSSWWYLKTAKALGVNYHTVRAQERRFSVATRVPHGFGFTPGGYSAPCFLTSAWHSRSE
jgi:hypothetical protein